VMPLTESATNYGIAGGSLTLSGAPTFTPDGLSFDGVDDFGWIDAIGGVNTIVFRAKFPNIASGITYPCVIGSNSESVSPGGGVTIYRQSTWRLVTNSTEDYSDGAADSQWHTFSVTFDGATRKFYIDGALVRSTTAFPSANGSIIKLGGGGTAAAKYPIIIRNIAIYNSAFSDANRLKLEQWATLDDIRVEDP
jgi:Concanavalin A-like lectin/glucanases superfamily